MIPRNFYAHLFDTGFTNNIGNPWPQLTGSPEDLNLYLGGPDVRAIIPHGDQVYQCANGMMMMGTKWPVKARFINDSQDAITAWTECEYLVTPAGERLINPLDWRCLYTGSQPPAEKGNDMNQNIHLYISNKKAGIETALEAKRYRFK